jgi:hypothetical protein
MEPGDGFTGVLLADVVSGASGLAGVVDTVIGAAPQGSAVADVEVASLADDSSEFQRAAYLNQMKRGQSFC